MRREDKRARGQDARREAAAVPNGQGRGLTLLVRIIAGMVALGTAHVSRLTAQTWNDSTTLAVVTRAVQARERGRPDSSLTGYRSRAHGFVFFLGQAGRDLNGTPRLIKADELEVEVYWRAPASSKQVILGWRDGRWLPTDIDYHRDHLGIVTNNFGDLIRIGEGDEVRDVPHPLAPEGPGLYDYRLTDSVELRGRGGAALLLQEVEVRPREPEAPRIVGTLSVDAATGDLVRFRFSFTAAAYLDSSLEDISVTLENARVERWWLPWRQEIEIRRRVTWFDFPARSVIRGRWEIHDYELNPALPAQALRGPAIGGLRRPDPKSFEWSAPLAELVRGAARPVEQQDLARVREEVERLVPGRMLSGLPRARPGVSSLSDIARVNRVQGLAIGFGGGFVPSPQLTVRPRVGYGTSDQRLTADLTASWEQGPATAFLTIGRQLKDLDDRQRISTLVNSLLAQEGGRDQRDYVLLDQARLGIARRVGGGLTLALDGGLEKARSVVTEASPARGDYRPNPALGEARLGVGRLALDYAAARLDRGEATEASLAIEGGTGGVEYARVSAVLGRLQPIGAAAVLVRLEGGAGSEELPRYRSFAIGGWGTLVGEPFRAFGGRRFALAQVELRFEVPFPALPLGAFVSTGGRVTVAPFVAAGWAGGAVAGLPWQPSRGARPVAGVALEWFHRLIRIEAGTALRTGDFGVTVDVSREWWGVL